MKQPAKYSFLGLLLAAAAWFFGLRPTDSNGVEAPESPRVEASAPVQAPPSERPQAEAPATSQPKPPPAKSAPSYPSTVGWTSKASLQSHFEKHGEEFGGIDQDEYLALAKALRDAPVGGAVLEAIRPTDGNHTRYDRGTSSFLVFTEDGRIITFFKPNDGEAYFLRQIDKEH